MSTATRGFASMSPDQVRAIASLGGKAAHAQGVAHEWTSSEAAVAGRLGGRAAQAKKVAPPPDAGESLKETPDSLKETLPAAGQEG